MRQTIIAQAKCSNPITKLRISTGLWSATGNAMDIILKPGFAQSFDLGLAHMEFRSNFCEGHLLFPVIAAFEHRPHIRVLKAVNHCLDFFAVFYDRADLIEQYGGQFLRIGRQAIDPGCENPSDHSHSNRRQYHHYLSRMQAERSR